MELLPAAALRAAALVVGIEQELGGQLIVDVHRSCGGRPIMALEQGLGLGLGDVGQLQGSYRITSHMPIMLRTNQKMKTI
jgi:hypothetical protein